jgi:hypothetical protein
MNRVTIGGVVVGTPTCRRSLVRTTTHFELDVSAEDGERVDRFQVVASRDLADDLRGVRHGDVITVTGYLRSEPFDMPDRSVWYRVELVACAISA